MKTNFFKRQVSGTAIVILCFLGIHSPLNSPAQAQPAPPPATSTTAASTLPPNIYPTSPLGQVIRLTQAGVDPSVIMTYVTNSGSTFNLDSDKIIYLKDIGLPSEIVTAMMQRDQLLQQQMAATTYQPPVQPPPEPATTEVVETAPPEQPVEPPAEVTTVNYFYDTLSPYGVWVDVGGYGRCWRPSVCVYNPGWQPYCDHGHWVYTNCGWYWYSDYSWGWAPFHYGRWFQHSRWGWCWAPDTMWGPSWVTWRYSSGYCGWAPLPPYASYRSGVGFFYHGSAVSFGFNWGLNENCFTFVPTQFFCDPHPRRHCVAPGQVTQIFNQTTVINNFNGQGHNLANRGIDPEHITAVTHTPIHPVAIRNNPSPSGHGSHGDQLSRDGRNLIISGPSRPGAPAQNQPRLPTPGQPAMPQQPVHHQQTPVVTTRDPQERNAYSVPAQHPSPPVNNYNYTTPGTPGHDTRTLPPRGREQQPLPLPGSNPRNAAAPATIPPSNQGQSGAAGASHHNAPAAAPAQSHPQPSQPPSSPAPSPSPRSSGQNQSQNSSGNNSGNNYNSGAGNSSGPRH